MCTNVSPVSDGAVAVAVSSLARVEPLWSAFDVFFFVEHFGIKLRRDGRESQLQNGEQGMDGAAVARLDERIASRTFQKGGSQRLRGLASPQDGVQTFSDRAHWLGPNVQQCITAHMHVTIHTITTRLQRTAVRPSEASLGTLQIALQLHQHVRDVDCSEAEGKVAALASAKTSGLPPHLCSQVG